MLLILLLCEEVEVFDPVFRQLYEELLHEELKELLERIQFLFASVLPLLFVREKFTLLFDAVDETVSSLEFSLLRILYLMFGTLEGGRRME